MLFIVIANCAIEAQQNLNMQQKNETSAHIQHTDVTTLAFTRVHYPPRLFKSVKLTAVKIC